MVGSPAGSVTTCCFLGHFFRRRCGCAVRRELLGIFGCWSIGFVSPVVSSWRLLFGWCRVGGRWCWRRLGLGLEGTEVPSGSTRRPSVGDVEVGAVFAVAESDVPVGDGYWFRARRRAHRGMVGEEPEVVVGLGLVGCVGFGVPVDGGEGKPRQGDRGLVKRRAGSGTEGWDAAVK